MHYRKGKELGVGVIINLEGVRGLRDKRRKICGVAKISDKSCRVLYFSHKMGTLTNGARKKKEGNVVTIGD